MKFTLGCFLFYAGTAFIRASSDADPADFTELLTMLSTMASFRKDSFDLADYFNANSEKMLRLSTAAGTFLAGQLQKEQRDDDEAEMLQRLSNIGQAAATFDRHYKNYSDVHSVISQESPEFTYSWGYGFNDRLADYMGFVDAFRGVTKHPGSPGLRAKFLRQCGDFYTSGRNFHPGPYAMVEFLRERIVGQRYMEENCALLTPRDAEIHAEVEHIFRELWYRIEYKSFWLEHRSIEAIQREYQVQLLEDERRQVWLKDYQQRSNIRLSSNEKDVETKLLELRAVTQSKAKFNDIDEALEPLTCVHHRHFPNINPQWPLFYRYPEPKCYLKADIVGNDYRRSAIYGGTRFLLKYLMESLLYGGFCLNITNQGDAPAMADDSKPFYKLLNESAHHLSAYAKTATELFFPTIAIATAKSAYGGSPIRAVAREPVESSNNSLATVAKEIHDALSVRGSAEHGYQVVVASTYGQQEFYAACISGTNNCFSIQSYMATNVFVTRYNITGADARASRTKKWLNDQRHAIEQILSDESSSSSLAAIFEAMSNRAEGVPQGDLFRGIVLLRRSVFFGPARIRVAVHGDARDARMWDSVLYEYDAKWTLNNAFTISAIFVL